MPRDRATSSLSLMERSWKPEAGLAEPVHVEQADKEKAEDDIVIVDVFLENEPQKIGRVIFVGQDPEPARGPDKLPDLKDILEHQGRGDGGDGEVVAFEPEERDTR